MNQVRLVAYSAGATVVTNSELELAQNIRFSTQYPAGLYGALSAWVARDPARPWQVQPAQRIVAYNGLTPVWEGRVTSPAIEDQAGGGRGQWLTAVGYWGDVLMARRWRKWWADTRLGEQAWPEATSALNAFDISLLGNVDVDRNNRLRFTPKNVAFSTNQFHRVVYTAPTGQTVKRVVFNYDLQEGAQNWTLGLYSITASSIDWSVSSSGTGTADVTLATPSQVVFFYLQSGANQTPASDGTIYGQITSLTVYSETGSINLTEICKDVRAAVSELSAGEGLIGSNTYAISPFLSEVDTFADILANAAGYGDSSYDPWAVGVRGSWLGTDGKPVLFAEQQPALTDYDYVISQDEANLAAPFRAVEDISAVRNYILVQYQDAAGRTAYLTPDDDVNLKDAASIARYGERHEIIQIDTSSSTQAANWARRYLAARKDAQWRVSGGMRIVGYVRSKRGALVPASEIQAGMRIRIANYLSDLNGTGLTFLISGTDYEDSSESCTLAVGQPDLLAPWLARERATR